jgi:nucleoid DNA-binding protein
MNYKELIEKISKETDLNPKKVKLVSDSLLHLISESVEKKVDLNLPFIKIFHREQLQGSEKVKNSAILSRNKSSS